MYPTTGMRLNLRVLFCLVFVLSSCMREDLLEMAKSGSPER